MGINIDFDLFFCDTSNFNFRHLGVGLDFVFQKLGKTFQLVHTIIARKIDVDDWKFRKIDISDHGVVDEVIGQVVFGLINGIFHILQG